MGNEGGRHTLPGGGEKKTTKKPVPIGTLLSVKGRGSSLPLFAGVLHAGPCHCPILNTPLEQLRRIRLRSGKSTPKDAFPLSAIGEASARRSHTRHITVRGFRYEQGHTLGRAGLRL